MPVILCEECKKTNADFLGQVVRLRMPDAWRTARRKRVFKLKDRGLSNAEISRRLNISTVTIWKVLKGGYV